MREANFEEVKNKLSEVSRQATEKVSENFQSSKNMLAKFSEDLEKDNRQGLD